MARASSSMYPEKFWTQEHFDVPAGTPLSMASAAVTPFAMCGRVFDNNQSLLRCACNLDGSLSREFFSCMLFQVIVSFKWSAFGRRRCVIRLLRYSVFQCLLMLLSSSFATPNDEGNRSLAVFACIACVPPLAWEIHHIIYHAVASTRQVSTQKSWFLRFLGAGYFRDFWNAYDLIRVIFTTVTLAAVAANSQSNNAWLLSITMYLRWLGLLFFLMPFESTGPLVRMIFQIAYGIRFILRFLLSCATCCAAPNPMWCRWLLLVLAIAIVAVAHSFWIIIGKNPSGEACSGRLDGFLKVLLPHSFLFNSFCRH
jgi:hypothetical protein